MNRILLKISGEFFQKGGDAINISKVLQVAKEIKVLTAKKKKVAVVVGAGNIMRGGRIKADLNRTILDYAGMCGAVTNGLVLKATLESLGIQAVLDSTLNISQVGTHHQPERAKQDYESGMVLIFGGTGLPYFSTDTASVVFSLELGVDVLLKATKVNGVYDKDPERFRNAKKYDKLTYDQILKDRLNVMDQTAFALARDNDLNMRIFKWNRGCMEKLLKNKSLGTVIN